MKIKFALAGMLLCFGAAQLQAQTQPLTRKGHFILGTTLLSYGANNSQGVSSSGSPQSTDSSHYKSSGISSSFDVWAGYFVSDRVCWGFSMNTTVTPTIPGYIYPNTTYSTFFRYYFNKPDSVGFDLFAEGNIGAGYSSYTVSEDRNTNANGGSTNGPSTNSATTINAHLGLCVAYNFTKHWGLEAMAGLNLASVSDSYGSYTTTDITSGQVNNMPASSSKFLYNSEAIAFRLHFYM
jgi:hypothetical protein